MLKRNVTKSQETPAHLENRAGFILNQEGETPSETSQAEPRGQLGTQRPFPLGMEGLQPGDDPTVPLLPRAEHCIQSSPIPPRVPPIQKWGPLPTRCLVRDEE